jgi:predicted ArsR family transcriptional regulator
MHVTFAQEPTIFSKHTWADHHAATQNSRTVDELAQALSLTDNTVRAHLAALERDGILQQRGVRWGSGKPTSVYDLTPEAEQLFPKAYDPVLQHLLEVLSERISADEVETLLGEVGRRMAARWKVPSGGLPVRIGAAIEVYNELGGGEIAKRSSTTTEPFYAL